MDSLGRYHRIRMTFWQEHVKKFRMINNCPEKFENAVKLCCHIKPEILIVSFRFTVHGTDHAIHDPYYPDHLAAGWLIY